MRRAPLAAALSLAAAAGIQAGIQAGGAGPAAAQATTQATTARAAPRTAPRAASQAVEDEVPPVFTATVSQGFTVDSNYDLDDVSPGTTTYADTLLDLAYVRSNENQTLSFGLNTGVRALWEAEEDFEFTLSSPSAAEIGYALEGASTAVEAELRYRQRQTDFTTDPGDFVSDEGVLPDNLDELRDDTRELRFDALVGLELATDAPSSYALNFTGTKIDYSDEAEGAFTPRRTTLTEAAWTLRVNPILSTIVGVGYSNYRADNPAETEINVAEVDAGLVWQPDENVRVRGGVGYADRKREQLVGGERETVDANSGATLRGDFLVVQENYNILGDARLTTAAPQTRFSFDVRGTYRLARSRVTGRAFNRYTTEDDGNTEVRVSGIGFGLVRDLNNVSRLGVDFAVARESDLEDDDEADADDEATDTTSASATVSLSYDLTRVVTTEVGYGYRSEVEDPSEAESHRVFFSIGRTFTAGL